MKVTIVRQRAASVSDGDRLHNPSLTRPARKAIVGELLQRFGLFLVVALSGCSGPREWEITVENKGDVPSSIHVTMRADGSSNAKIDDLTKGKTVKLIAGSGETIVNTIKVVRGKDEQVLTPSAKLSAGKRYAIVIGADGKLETSISDR